MARCGRLAERRSSPRESADSSFSADIYQARKSAANQARSGETGLRPSCYSNHEGSRWRSSSTELTRCACRAGGFSRALPPRPSLRRRRRARLARADGATAPISASMRRRRRAARRPSRAPTRCGRRCWADAAADYVGRGRCGYGEDRDLTSDAQISAGIVARRSALAKNAQAPSDGTKWARRWPWVWRRRAPMESATSTTSSWGNESEAGGDAGAEGAARLGPALALPRERGPVFEVCRDSVCRWCSLGTNAKDLKTVGVAPRGLGHSPARLIAARRSKTPPRKRRKSGRRPSYATSCENQLGVGCTRQFH